MVRFFLSSAAVAILFLSGCHSSPPAPQQSSAQPGFKVYHLRGKVVNTHPESGELTVAHEAIAGFMGAMTMPYKLKDPSVMSELHPGDVITADVLVSQNPDADVLLDHIVVVAQGKADYKPAMVYHVPAPGDQVPDFKLHNQDGRAIHLSQYRGQALLITFIYTRCPLPDFCPRVTRNFAAINQQISASPALATKTHLLSVSFDPEHDTPERLRAYGAQYIGSDAKSAFGHWELAVPTQAEVLEMAKYFDIGLTPGDNDTINHTLSTTLIGPDGKVAQFYPGNEWTPAQVLADLKRVEQSAG
jgi:protein SCO1